METMEDVVEVLKETCAILAKERDKLQAWKDWVHNYLDTHGVPYHPPGTHGAEGCRIGDRMDWVWARVAELRRYVSHFETCDALRLFPDNPLDADWMPSCTCGLAAALEEMK